jgi:rare lipoprotein A (peptidoglycan hydrolase)
MRSAANHRVIRVAIATLVGVATLTGLRPAVATDLESLRARAQRIADRVTDLEHRLNELGARRAALEERTTRATQAIALLQVQIRDTHSALRAARARYVSRAVEAYKQGPTSDLALLLAADDLPALFDAAEAASRAAEEDVEALDDLVAAAAAHERVQKAVDRRKQELLAAHAATIALAEEISATLSERRGVLADLQREITRLEEQARIEAARDVGADVAFAQLLAPSGPAPGIPDGYVRTGVTFEGIASWYGPGFAGETTANGQIFDPNLYTAASRDLPFGTILYVEHEGRGVVVVINDRGPYIEERILDLSRAAAEAIGLGLGWVTAEILVPAGS